MELWRVVVGYGGRYEVSSGGRIRSYIKPIVGGVKWLIKPRLLNPSTTSKGYRRISLCDGCVEKSYSVTRLVLAAFAGPCPDGMEAAHLNGDPGDNSIENLAWVTHRENESHKRLHGTTCCGSKNGNSKLTAKQVMAILVRLKNGERGVALAAEYGITPTTISDIGRGKTWTYVGGTRRTNPNRGIKNGRSKLTEEQVRQIREVAGTDSDSHIARQYGVSTETVRRVRIGSHWRSIA